MATHLPELKALLSHPSREQVQQGLELLYTLDNPALWRTLAEDWKLLSSHAAGHVSDLYWAALAAEHNNTTTWPGAHACEVAVHILLNAGRLDHSDELVLSRTSIASLAPFRRLSRLKTLNLSHCYALEDIDAIAGFPDLASLFMAGCRRVPSLAPLEGLSKLSHVDLGSCAGIDSLEPLAASAARMWRLTLSDMDEHPLSLSPISAMRRLARLDLSGWHSLDDISVLADLPLLYDLDLNRCIRLFDIDVLATLPKLRELALEKCPVRDLGPLRRLGELRYLDLNDCINLRSLGPTGNWPELDRVLLNGCTRLTDISALAGAPKLKYLFLNGCSALEDISLISELPQLEVLSMEDCDRLPSRWQRRFDGREAVEAFQEAYRSEGRRQSRARLVDPDISIVQAELDAIEADPAAAPLAALPYHLSWGTLKGPGDHHQQAALRLLALAGRLDGTESLRLPPGLDAAPLPPLPRLRRLFLDGQDPRSLGALSLDTVEGLFLTACPAVPDFSATPRLKMLVLSKAGAVSLADLSLPPSLKELRINGPVRGGLSALRGLDLHQLVLSDCPDVDDLSPLREMQNLTRLTLTGSRVSDLRPIASLRTLEQLDLQGNTALSTIALLREHPTLSDLKLTACPQLTDVSALLSMPALISADLRQNPQLPAPLTEAYLGCVDLAAMRLDPEGLSWMSRVARLWTSLEEGDLSVLDELPADSPIWALLATELEHRPDLGWVSTDTDLPGPAIWRIARQVGWLREMPYLNLREEDFVGLDLMAGLPVKRLNLMQCEELQDLSAVATMRDLEELDLRYATRVADLSPLAGLPKLVVLRLEGCSELPESMRRTYASREELAALQATLG